VGIFASAMAIIKGEESIQEGQLKQESNVTEWDRARGIIARGLKLAAEKNGRTSLYIHKVFGFII